ncbi:DUF1330 domain-containing protein [Amaricoccus tamworthensis]|uniref:DUF1330 domain-containing protein n=1 Tax=Amaricoccus tamworthensis TaxID=57002 RepID=UPI003C7E68F2
MSCYSILDVTPTSEDWIPDYVPVAIDRIAAHGGRYLARTTQHKQVEGEEREAALRIIIEWPSRENAEAFIADSAYAPHLKARTDGSTSHHYLIEGQDDLA